MSDWTPHTLNYLCMNAYVCVYVCVNFYLYMSHSCGCNYVIAVPGVITAAVVSLGVQVSVLLGQDIPQWQLPMHCQLVEEDNPNSKECLWKNNAVVRVNFFQERVDGGTDTVGCYNVSWETLRSSV